MKAWAHQIEIHDAVLKFLRKREGNGLVVSPTGTGKTHACNSLIKTLVTKHSTRVMCVTHIREVIDQNCSSMLKYWPQAPAGIYSAGLKSRDTRSPIIYAGIQSLAGKAWMFKKVNVLMVDEAHLISPNEGTAYQKFIKELKQENPLLRVIGFTATPYRLGQGLLVDHELFDEIIIDLSETTRFNQFVSDGILSMLVPKEPDEVIDVTNLSMRGGEFLEAEAQEAADTDALNKCVVKECIKHGSNRKHWLVFASGLKHAANLERMFKAAGVSCTTVDAKDKWRKEKIEAFEREEIRCLINVGILTTGYDLKTLDLIAVARVTQSTALWVQILGRGTRVAPGKKNCVVLDFGRNTFRLGPINAPIIPRPRKKGDGVVGEAPVKKCPECSTLNHTRAVVCIECGYKFPPSTTIEKVAGNAALMVGANPEPVIEEFEVLSVVYKRGVSKAGNPYLCSTYFVGGYSFKEYLFFGNENAIIQRRVSVWWQHRGGAMPVPESVEEAEERTGELLTPTLIRVDVSKKYPEVLGCEVPARGEVAEDDIPF
jgi:DNA repair protein RadD